MSGLFSRWAEFRDEILENFTECDNRFINSVQYTEWQRARQVSEKKGRHNPDSGESLEIDKKSVDAEWTHACVNVNVSVPVVQELPLQELNGNNIPKKSMAAQCEEIYIAYPRHTAPQPAYKAIEKALKRKPFDELLGIVKLYAVQTKQKIADGKMEKQFIPHPATWFNQGRYDDEDLKPAPQYEIVEVSPEVWWAENNPNGAH
jgi:hypothetical protein